MSRTHSRGSPARIAPALLLAASIIAQGTPATARDTMQPVDLPGLARACAGKDGWAEPAPPARIFGNSWYVGTCGISAVLVTGDDGHVLVDSGVPEAAPLILANIEALGFDPADVAWLVGSHEHYDHVGAHAALQEATGAKVAVLDTARATFATGELPADDPQFGVTPGFAPVTADRVLRDGESLTLGKLVLTAHATPAHAAGSTSWTWRSCNGDDCARIAYADSATTVSADSYRFSDHPARIAGIHDGLAAIAGLPCSLLLTPHPSASAMFARFAGKAPLRDDTACTAYAAKAETAFAARLEREAASTADTNATKAPQ